MDNRAIAALFRETGDLLRIHGGDPHRARAFLRTAEILERLKEPVAERLKLGRLAGIKGIGPGSLERIREMLRTGTCRDLERLRAEYPTALRTLLEVRGLGPTTARLVYQRLGITTPAELERAARSGLLLKVPGVGDKTVAQIIASLESLRRPAARLLLPDAIALGERLVSELVVHPAVLRAVQGGSARRRKETVGDLDFLVASTDGRAVCSRFSTLDEVAEVLLFSDTRVSVRLKGGMQADLRVVPPDTFGAGLHYFTGSRAHNIALRLRANQRGLAISEHGIFRKGTELRVHAAPREEDVFNAVGLPFIEPELRENTGEIEAAERGRLPRLVTERDLKGELSLHSERGEGRASPRTLVVAARALGLEYVAFVDAHHAFASASALREHWRSLRRIEEETGVGVLAGVTVDIQPDGDLPLSRALLSEAGWVVARVRTRLDMPASAMTERVERALASGLVDCLAHPTGRLLLERDGIALDLDRVLRAARKAEVALEVNGDPRRLDLDANACRYAKELGVRLVVSADARAPHELARRSYATWTARRGWISPGDVLNTRAREDLEGFRAARLGPRRRLPRRHPTAALPLSTQRPEPEVLGLEELLREERIDDALFARLDRFVREGDDPALERALGALANNPLQKAFALVVKARAERGV